MCNLSEGIYERAWRAGYAAGYAAGCAAAQARIQQERERKKRFLIPCLLELNFDIPTIAHLAECSEEEVHTVAMDEENQRLLERRAAEVKASPGILKEHELIEDAE